MGINDFKRKDFAVELKSLQRAIDKIDYEYKLSKNGQRKKTGNSI